MDFRKAIRRTIVAVVVCTCAAIGVVPLFNLGGWRARVLSRIMRLDNKPIVITPPPDFQPRVPSGFAVSIYANKFVNPRWLAVAPSGDVFVADSGAGEVIALQGLSAQGSAASRFVFADHLNLPFGIAFHEDYVYVADTNEVLRFRYDPKSSKRLGDGEHILDLPGLGYNQHWTRSLALSCDGQKLFVSVGSLTNVSVESDSRRAAILVANPDGSDLHVYANGLRNAVGIACQSETGKLWATVNERDDLADDLPSDYFTSVTEKGFYGWPYAYDARHPDNRVASRPGLVSKMIIPDVLLGAHVAPLQFAFYDKSNFPAEYWHGAFIAEHGSWNRRIRSGYQVVFVPFRNGSPKGEPRTFFSGFVPDPAGKEVYGRVVGIAVAVDGALLISDDGGKLIWRISYLRARPAESSRSNTEHRN